MVRRLFDFKSGKHFVASSNKTTLKVYELSNPTIHPTYIRKTHWKEVVDITACDHDDSDVEEEEEESPYGGLMFFDGQGKIEGREALTKLAQHLTRLQLMVSPQGLCFQDVTELGEHKDFGIHYLRLNDLFNWPQHGVTMAVITTWSRLVLKYTMPDRETKRAMGKGGVSKEKYEELKRVVREKEEGMEEQDAELQKLKEEMEGASGKHEAELRELEKKKDEELRRLTKKKTSEFKMLKKEMDEELRKKNDEMKLLRKEKDEEVRKMREEVENLRRGKEDEAGKVRKDMEEMKRRLEKEHKDKEQALQSVINQKSIQLNDIMSKNWNW